MSHKWAPNMSIVSMKYSYSKPSFPQGLPPFNDLTASHILSVVIGQFRGPSLKLQSWLKSWLSTNWSASEMSFVKTLVLISEKCLKNDSKSISLLEFKLFVFKYVQNSFGLDNRSFSLAATLRKWSSRVFVSKVSYIHI